MKLKISSEKENPLLKRKEINFQIEHAQTGGTTPRLEVRKAIAEALKVNLDFVYIKKFETKTGTQLAVGTANIYESLEQAKLVEPEYVIKRNVPAEKTEKKEGEKKE